MDARHGKEVLNGHYGNTFRAMKCRERSPENDLVAIGCILVVTLVLVDLLISVVH